VVKGANKHVDMLRSFNMKKHKIITALGILVLLTTIAICMYLFVFGAKIASYSSINQPKTPDEYTAQKILSAIVNDNNKELETLIADNKNLDLNNRLVFQGILPVEQCAFYGRLAMFKELLADGVQLSFENQNACPDILLCACKGGNVELVKYIQSLGKSLLTVDLNGSNAALYAAESGNIEMFNYVVEAGVDPNKTNANNEDVVMKAASSNDLSLFHDLVSKGYSVAGKTTTNQNILYFASNQVNLIELINQYPNLIFDKTLDQQNLLFYTVGNNYFDATKLLLEKGLDVNELNESGSSILMSGVMIQCDTSIIQLLLNNHADKGYSNNGVTAYDLAKQNSFAQYYDLLK